VEIHHHGGQLSAINSFAIHAMSVVGNVNLVINPIVKNWMTALLQKVQKVVP